MKLRTTYIGPILAAVFALPAHAAIIEYELEGQIKSPIYSTVHGHHNTGLIFDLEINRGDLILSHDDGGTANFFDDDVVNISGVTLGCVRRDPYSCGDQVRDGGDPMRFNTHQRFGDGGFWGWGEFTWDMEISNPLTSNTTDFVTTGDDDLVFGAQQAGTLQLNNPRHGVPSIINLELLNHKTDNYAFRLFDLLPKGDGEFRIDAWIRAIGGILGGRTRFESWPSDAAFNADLMAYRRNHMPPEEIPEPMTLALLLSGLVGGRFIQRKK